MQVARRVLAEQGQVISAQELVAMVTSGAAAIACVDQYIGELAEGRRADVLVLERRKDDPYDTVCQADRSSVELVVVDGRLVYGRNEWFNELVPEAAVATAVTPFGPGELVWAWGRLMRLHATQSDPSQPADESTKLSYLRNALIARFRQTGPIFA
jgi:hypothetical protein